MREGASAATALGLSSPQHENIFRFSDERAGLRAIVALHRPLAGVAMGATRLYPYASEADALYDVLRLSEAMSYKAACAGIAVGGAKAVIIADPRDKSERMLRAYAHFVDSLRGRFVTGQDLNITAEDVQMMALETRYMVGINPASAGPATMTARGAMAGLEGALHATFKSSSFKGIRVAIQGVGEVGGRLAGLLVDAGAKVIITDINMARAEKLGSILGVEVVEPDEILTQDVDVFSPCGRGGILNAQTIPLLKAKIVGGVANNQLADCHHDALLLKKHDIAYCPDFVINAGGLIEVYNEFAAEPPARTLAMVDGIAATIKQILLESEDSQLSTYEVSLRLARKRREGLFGDATAELSFRHPAAITDYRR